jgi:hypothetical protein
MIKLQTGDSIFYKDIKAFLSRIQQWVLNTNLSHTSVICGRLWGKDIAKLEPIELEADIKVRIHSFNANPQNIEVWRWYTDIIPQEIIDRVLDDYRRRYEDHWYGFIQWLTIAIRRISELVIPSKYRDNVKRWNILWGWGTTCSELLYLIETTILRDSFNFWKYKLICAHPNDDRKYEYKHKMMLVEVFLFEWKNYNKDTFTPKDQKEIYIKCNYLGIKGRVW